MWVIGLHIQFKKRQDFHECCIPQSDICLLLKVKSSSIENHASSKVNKFGGLTQPHTVFPIKTIRTLLVCLLISSKCILLVRWPSLILLIAIQPAIPPPAHVMHLKSVVHIRHHQLTRQACHNYMLPWFQWNTVPVEIMCIRDGFLHFYCNDFAHFMEIWIKILLQQDKWEKV